MANFTAGTSFSDGVTNDVTAAKLNALVADAVPTSNLSLNSTTGTIATFNSTTPTFLGAITASTNTINVGSGQIYKDATGNVGVGTATPLRMLHIQGSSSGVSGTARATLIADDTTAYAAGVGGAITFRGKYNSAGDYAAGGYIQSQKTNATNGNDSFDLALGTRNSGFSAAEVLRLTSDGNVGVGTASPISKLDITGPQPTLAIKNNDYVGNSVGTVISIFPEAASGDCAARLQVKNAGGSTFGKLLLNPDGGNVGVGTASPTAQLELSTDSAKKPSTNTWTIASDQRLKTNITNADNDRCYEIVKQVPLKRYTWKSEVYSQEQVKDRSKLGWIAQDVEAVFPKAVGTNRFAYNQVFENVVTPELDSDGNTVLDENGVAKTKTEKRLVSEDVIEDCKDLNSDQIYAAMYGTIQKLIEKVEFLESKVATLEAA
jgi:Chaperone of endosialidase